MFKRRLLRFEWVGWWTAVDQLAALQGHVTCQFMIPVSLLLLYLHPVFVCLLFSKLDIYTHFMTSKQIKGMYSCMYVVCQRHCWDIKRKREKKGLTNKFGICLTRTCTCCRTIAIKEDLGPIFDFFFLSTRPIISQC